MIAGELMDASVVTLRRDTTLSEIYAVMNQYQQTDFPVVDADLHLVGMLYEENILKAINDSFQAVDGNLPMFSEAVRHAARVSNMRAEEIMTPDIGWVSTETDIAKIAAVLAEKKVRCLPVYGDGHVLGVVSERAIFMELLKQGLELKKIPDSGYRAALKKNQAITERRRYARKPVSFKLAYKPTDAQGSPMVQQGKIAKCLNLSPGGMLVTVAEASKEDDIIDLAFEVPLSGTVIRRLARVTRVMPAQEGGYQLG
ncbi:MAG: CBS domain-containing protein, partial [Candidatus Omnitrophica bacterium]|nr:CBS domain-containing protein [Candidatus Omnitrophota bacterium]